MPLFLYPNYRYENERVKICSCLIQSRWCLKQNVSLFLTLVSSSAIEHLHENNNELWTLKNKNSFNIWRHVMKASPLTACAQIKSQNWWNGFVVFDDAVAAVQTAFRTSGTSLHVTSPVAVRSIIPREREMFYDPQSASILGTHIL